MTDPVSPYEAAPPSSRRLLTSIGIAVVVAALVVVVFVLPAQFGMDPTGLGARMGLTQMQAPAGRTLLIKDVIGGNERFREVTVPDAGDPIPLPNPAVAQIKATEPQTRTLTVKLGLDEQTEVKAVLDEAQVLVYSWKADGDVYTDFHGHQPGMGKEFVRYEEQQQGRQGQGSLVAPFSGEHGWYWLNLADGPVSITLTVTGYFNEMKDYGIFP